MGIKINISIKAFLMAMCCVWGMTLNTALAQDEVERKVFVSNDFENGKQGTVHVKWMVASGVPTRGANLFRRLDDGDWTLVNGSPFKCPPSLAPKFAGNQLIELLHKAFSQEETDVEAMKNGSYFIINLFLQGIFNHEIALAFNIAHSEDLSALGASKVQYKVVPLSGSDADVEYLSEAISIATFAPKKAVQNLTFDRKRRNIEFMWQVENNRYFAVNVYRWSTVNPTKKLLTKAPITIQKNKEGNYPKVYFDDTQINKDTSYIYEFVGIDYFGQLIQPTNPIEVAMKDFDAPFSTFNVAAKQSGEYAVITWDALEEEDLAGFRIIRSTNHDSGYVAANEVLVDPMLRSFNDAIPPPGDYFYKVVSVDQSGNETESAVAIANIVDLKPPCVPQGLNVKPDTGKFVFSWEPCAETDLVGYYLYKAPIESKEYVVLNPKPIAATTYEEKMEKNIKNKFKYAIVSIDTAKNRSNLSDSVIVQLPDVVPPSQPFLITIIQSDSALTMKWFPVLDEDLMHYQIFKVGTEETAEPILIDATVSKMDTTYNLKAQNPGETWNYYLQAIDSSANVSLPSTPYMLKTDKAVEAVSAEKFAVKFNKKSKGNELSWAPITKADFYALTVLRKEEGQDWKQCSGALKTENKYIDNKVVSGKSYSYKLLIVNTEGVKTYSNELNITAQ